MQVSLLYVQLETGNTCSTSKICDYYDSIWRKASLWLQTDFAETAVVIARVNCLVYWLSWCCAA